MSEIRSVWLLVAFLLLVGHGWQIRVVVAQDAPAATQDRALEDGGQDSTGWSELFSTVARLLGNREEVSAETHGYAAADAILVRNYDEGIRRLRQAMSANKRDAGQKYHLRKKNKLSEKALAHGKQQVAQMLQDRPVMRNHADGDSELAKWCARKFAGEDLGFTIDWDADPPESGYTAEHIVPSEDSRGLVRVAKVHLSGEEEGQDLNFEELWSSVIYELHNISKANQFNKVHEDTLAGKLNKEDYVKANFAIELEAIQETRAFYATIFLPWARKQKVRTDPELWYLYTWGGADVWIEAYGGKDGDYPWGYYGDYYDELLGGG